MHQDRAATIVRRKKKEPELGLPPALEAPTAGKDIKVFDAEQDELEDDDDMPPMWRTHPADAEREENSKEAFVPAVAGPPPPVDPLHRVGGTQGADELQVLPDGTSASRRTPTSTEAQKVQEYIDNEHAETTYDPKYHGVYDDRPLEPGELQRTEHDFTDSPWTEERMEKVYEKLFDGCRQHAEEHADLHKELQFPQRQRGRQAISQDEETIKEIEEKLDDELGVVQVVRPPRVSAPRPDGRAGEPGVEAGTRRALSVSDQVQKFYQDARHNFNKADAYIGALRRGDARRDPGARRLRRGSDRGLATAWKVLKNIIQEAREINLPAMKNFEEGERLADFILEGKMVPEPPLSELKGTWISKLMTQLQGVKNRCFRLHFKSVGGILALQEKIAAAWVEARAPICAEVIEPESILSAEVIPAEVVVEGLVDEPVIAAEVIPAEVAVESFVEALPLDEIAPAPPLIPAAPVAPEPLGAPMAGFVAASPPAPVVPPPMSPVAAGPIQSNAVEAAKAAAGPLPEPAPISVTPPAAPMTGEPVFSLDLDAAAAQSAELPPAIVAEALPLDVEPVAPDPAASAEIFALDADTVVAADAIPVEVAVVAELRTGPTPAPTPTEVAPGGSGSVSAPTARPAFGSGSSASMPALSELNGSAKSPIRQRPAVKITIVKPGEKSPFAK